MMVMICDGEDDVENGNGPARARAKCAESTVSYNQD